MGPVDRWEGEQSLVSAHVPDDDDPEAAGRKSVTVGTPGEPEDSQLARDAFGGGRRFAAGFPDQQRLVGPSRGQPLAIGTPCQGGYRPFVTGERPDESAAGNVPEPNSAVVAAGGELPARGVPGQRLDGTAMAGTERTC